MPYDCVIIGGGMSGLAAGIRLAHFGKSVVLLERHHRLGGLNSYFTLGGETIETGLHAMTNLAASDASKSLPLRKILRQLRVSRDALAPRRQRHSLISFPDAQLRFSDEFADFEDSVRDAFPDAIDDFKRLDQVISNYDALNLNNPYVSARGALRKYLRNQRLIEMLLCPLMIYGSAVEDDMDFAQFVIMYKSVFREGFWRPGGGIRSLLDLLTTRFTESGGETRMKTPVAAIRSRNGKVEAVETESGEVIETKAVLSSVGLPETAALCDPPLPESFETPKGQLGFVEVVVGVKPDALNNVDFTINFFNEADAYSYRRPDRIVDPKSGVICVPTNFRFLDGDAVPRAMIRLTALSDHAAWPERSDPGYPELKRKVGSELIRRAERHLPLDHLEAKAEFVELMTPRSITRFTGRFNGAVYGSPRKIKNGLTPFANLFICGTDQGFLGVVGSMLSGVSIANLHLLR